VNSGSRGPTPDIVVCEILLYNEIGIMSPDSPSQTSRGTGHSSTRSVDQVSFPAAYGLARLNLCRTGGYHPLIWNSSQAVAIFASGNPVT